MQLISPGSSIAAFTKDRLTRVGIFLSLLLNAIIWALLLWRIRSYNDFIPVHYNIYFGVDLFQSKQYLYTLPGTGLLFLIINLGLGFLMFARQKILSYFLTFGSFLIQLLLLFAALAAIVLNS